MDATLSDRLDRIERNQKRLLTFLILVVVGGVLTLIAAVSSVGVVRANRIVLEDLVGNERIMFQVTEKDSTAVTVRDGKGRRRATFLATADGQAVLSFLKVSGEPTLNLRMDNDGRASVLMGQKSGLMLTVDPQGEGSISLVGADGQPRVRIPRANSSEPLEEKPATIHAPGG